MTGPGGPPPGGEADAATLRLQLAAIVESSDDAIIGKTIDGTITSWNPSAERLYGHSADEAVGRSIEIIEPPQRAGEMAEILRRLAAGERIEHHETQRLAKDGRLIEISLTVSPIRAVDGEIVGASAIAREVGEQRRAGQYRDTLLALTSVLAASSTVEEAAPRMLEELAAGLGSDLAAMWLVDERGAGLDLAYRWPAAEIVSAPPEASASRTRFARGEGLPGSVWRSGEPAWLQDVTHGARFERSAAVAGEEVRAAVALPLWSSAGVLGVLEFFSRDQRPPDDMLSDLLRAIGAQVGGFVERARATEAVLRAREDAERANLAKSEFLSRMSHELRTPLNAVLGFGQLLELERLGERQRESVEQILKAGRHLLQLIDEVLDLARIEAGQLPVSPEPVAVAEVVGESLALVVPLAGRRGIQLGSDLGAAGSRWVLADRQRLKQVLLNLLSNAIKYNRERGSVHVRAGRETSESVAIVVSDTGPGIRPEQRDGLFEPFERLGAEGSGVEGTGLGLALSKRLMEAMDGTLTAQTGPGSGTSMVVELPRAEPQQRAAESPPAAPVPVLGARTLLYIEDNLANLRLVERVLESFEDLRLLPAMQGKLGLELAREHHPDLVLLDLHLPDLPGREVLLRLKAEPQLSGIPVVVISADATERQRERLLAAGAHAYLSKPLDVRRFLTVVDECLSASGDTA